MGDGVLVVDLSREGVDAAARRELEAALMELPCVSVALGSPELSTGFDVCVAGEDALGAVMGGIARNPIAALALVQLLRRGEQRSTGLALLDESLVYSTLQAGPEFASWLAGHVRKDARMEPTTAAVRVERSGGEMVLTLDRPEKRNAFSAEMRDALCEALEIAVADESIARVVLRGEGRAFCSGGDLDEFGTLPDPATAHLIRSTRHAARLLDACASRAEAQVHGACIGAGIELPAFCERVVAAPDATFRLPELGMGLVPGAGGTCSIPRRIGRQRTAWLALTGEVIDVDRAVRWGLVDAVREKG